MARAKISVVCPTSMLTPVIKYACNAGEVIGITSDYREEGWYNILVAVNPDLSGNLIGVFNELVRFSPEPKIVHAFPYAFPYAQTI